MFRSIISCVNCGKQRSVRSKKPLPTNEEPPRIARYGDRIVLKPCHSCSCPIWFVENIFDNAIPQEVIQ